MKRILLALLFSLLVSNAYAAARFGICNAACTWDNASTAMWSTTSGGATGASAPASGDDVTLDANTCTGGVTCTITVNANLNIGSLTMGACTASTTGCILDFSVHNNNVTFNNATGLKVSGTGTRTLKMGTGTFSIAATSGVSTVIDFSITTNLTLTPGTSTLKITGNTALKRTFATNGATFANLLIDSNTSGGGVVLSQNAATFTGITLNSPTQFFLPQGNTTIATSITSTGISGINNNYLASNSFVSRATLSIVSGTQTMAWTAIDGVTFTGGATFIANNSFNVGQNSGVTINAPVGGGGGCIIGGWLLWRDITPEQHDNFPAFIDKEV